MKERLSPDERQAFEDLHRQAQFDRARDVGRVARRHNEPIKSYKYHDPQAQTAYEAGYNEGVEGP